MIVYLAKKSEFLSDVDSNCIQDRILAEFQRRHHKSVGKSEIDSWKNSMNYMHRILSGNEIPDDAGVAIEFGVPQTSKRIDFILTGKNEEQRQVAVIVELKQWTEASATTKDAVVETWLGGARVETAHPSYQAWSYAVLLEDYNETVREREIALKPCAYLHNCVSRTSINSSFYREYTKKAPAFLRDDAAKLRAFLKQHVKYGDCGEIIYQIRDSKISPSKDLADRLVSMLQGNREFLMIDDQKLVYETALAMAQSATDDIKKVLIVEGGPGTGKSVVAINLIVELTARAKLVQYVSKNAAPRTVYESKLTGSMTKSRISNIFKGSGSYLNTEPNTFDALVVDEAHRLNKKSGLFQNKGENQIKEIMAASRFSVFFIDEGQRVTFKDIGSKEEILRWADFHGAKTTALTLESQFRCNGSDGYLAWVDNTLDIRETANRTLDGINYEFVVCESPNELHELIYEKNKKNNKARMVAGYCWDWKGKNNLDVRDIEIPEHGYSARWNLSTDGSLWIIKPESVSEVGCIHTCQGLELEYIGVIFGPDLVVRNGEIITDAGKRSSMDSSVKGYKKQSIEDPDRARAKADEIIKNTYRTLMTRGQKGCFVYSVDDETNQYFKNVAAGAVVLTEDNKVVPFERLPLRVLYGDDVRPYVNSVPVYDLRIAAGIFSHEQAVDDVHWVELPEPFMPKDGYFVARVVGESMNKRIPNGSWCLFKADPGSSRQGKVVLVQHRDIQDHENGGQYTVKIYESEKREVDGTWEHGRIVLKPDTTVAGFVPIVLEVDQAVDLLVCGELVAVLGQE